MLPGTRKHRRALRTCLLTLALTLGLPSAPGHAQESSVQPAEPSPSVQSVLSGQPGQPAPALPAGEHRRSPGLTGSTLILTEENDFFAGTDEHYTNGLKLTWISGDLKGYAEDERLPAFLLPYLNALPFVNEAGRQYNVALSLGQNMYTPRNTRLTTPQPDDRPYAGWSYLALALHAKTPDRLDTFETSLGIVGPSARAGETQNDYHSAMGFRRALGWKHQIHDEPGVMLSWMRTLRAARVDLGRDVAWDFLPRYGATAGNVMTHAAVGFETRLGWELPLDFGTSLIQPGGGVSAPAAPDDIRLKRETGLGLHVFFGAEGRAVARNIFLDGNTWEKSAHVSRNPFVGDLMAGVGLLIGPAKLTYTHVYRTEEYKGQNTPQMFGSVNLSVTF